MTKPSHNISIPCRSKPGQPDIWRKVGAAWEKENGSITGKINLLPVDGWDGTFAIHPSTEYGYAEQPDPRLDKDEIGDAPTPMVQNLDELGSHPNFRDTNHFVVPIPPKPRQSKRRKRGG